jgi:hypothetical protein
MKSCNKCSVIKPLDEFPKRASCPDGHRDTCKVCKAVQDRDGRLKRLELPGGREKERRRAEDLRAQRSDAEKERVKKREIETCRRNRQKVKDSFFAKHGCTWQEFKWKQDGEAFITDGQSRNGQDYDYDGVDYKGVWTPVKIRCNKHQSDFLQSPKSHKLGSGCPSCAKEATGTALRRSQEDFLKQAEDFCGDKFTFADVLYVDNVTHIQVTCKVHGNFPISPGNLLSGKGCPSCAKYGYRNNIPGSLYVLHNGELTKVGITNGEVPVRVRQINSKGKGFQIISQYLFEDGKDASDLEMTLLRELRKEYLQPTEKFDGSTECFFGLDPYELARDISARLPQQTEETNDYRPEYESRKGSPPNC